MKFHDFLNALASAKMGKQPGSDGVVVEMVRALSLSTLLWLYLLFLVRLGGWVTERPDAWREVVLKAIPKKSDKVGPFDEIHQSAAYDTKNSTSVLCSPLSDVKEIHMRQTSLAMSQGDPLLVSLQHCDRCRAKLLNVEWWPLWPRLMWNMILIVSNMRKSFASERCPS